MALGIALGVIGIGIGIFAMLVVIGANKQDE